MDVELLMSDTAKRLLDDSLVNEAVDRGIREVQPDIERYLTTYPSRRGTYARTGTAKAGWVTTVESFPSSPLVTFANDVDYAPYLYSAEQQPAWHQGRWKTVEDAVEQFDPTVEKAVEHALERSIE